MDPDIRKKEMKVNLIMAVVMSLLLGIIAVFLARAGKDDVQLQSMPPLPVMLITGVLESLVAGIIVALVVPLGKWGRMLAAKAGANPPGLKFTLINCIPLAVGNTLIISLALSLISMLQAYGKIDMPNKPPFLAMWLGQWIIMLPVTLVAAYVIAVVISPVIVRAVGLGGPQGGPPKAGAGSKS
ncbi:MAG: hypothetical protein J5776_07145 [Clostridiales bacterium]|nr:hypothetical protein [Clostridiales bacterium]